MVRRRVIGVPIPDTAQERSVMPHVPEEGDA
jgi:hypothetical protein